MTLQNPIKLITTYENTQGVKTSLCKDYRQYLWECNDNSLLITVDACYINAT